MINYILKRGGYNTTLIHLFSFQSESREMESRMNNESLGLSPSNTNTDTQDKYIDLSQAIYNRNTHDKSMCVEVVEINSMISIESILKNNKDREKLYSLVNSSYCSLFKKEFMRSIEELNKEDLKKLCNYSSESDTFWGNEYRVLRLILKDYLKELKRDIKADRLNNILKLSISKDETKLIVKLFPNKSTAKDPVLYAQSLLYLVLFSLYYQTNNYSSQYNKRDLIDVINSVLTYPTPIITKVVYTISINADDNYTWFLQLKQLASAYGFLIKSENENQIVFTFRPKEQDFTSTLYTPVIDNVPSDTNFSARFIKCSYKLEKENILTCDTTIVSKDMVDCVFASFIDSDQSPVSLFSSINDSDDIYLAHYKILYNLLSFTQQHEQLKREIRLNAKDFVANGNFQVISDIINNDNDYKVKILTKKAMLKPAFNDIKKPLPDDKLIKIIRDELTELKIKNGHIDYMIIILELFQKNKDIIDKELAPLDVRTSYKIKKIISNVKRKAKGLAPTYTLNEFYKRFYD